MKLLNFILVINFFIFLYGDILAADGLYEIPISVKDKEIYICFDKIELCKFAEHIKSKKIYEPKLWGTDVNRSQIHNALLSVSFFLRNKSEQLYTDSSQVRKDFLQVTKLQSIDKPNDPSSILVRRKEICKRFVELQNFFEAAIDRDALKTNPFSEGWIFDPIIIFRNQHGGIFGASRYITLMEAESKNELPDNLKQELTAYREAWTVAEKKHEEWLFNKTEYNLQQKLIEKQQKLLKEFHDRIVELYSFEPRADGELLELFSKSKYPETEKVKILMELKIPYKNFRRWESQDRKFQTNAQFISLDKPTQNVTLEKPNGKKTVVKLYVLRYADKKYIQDLLNEKQK
jgi:hypothetical protein